MKRLRWLAVPAVAAVLFGAVSCGGGSDDKTSSDILASGEYTLNGWSTMKVVDFTALSSARLARIGSVSVKYSINLEEANAGNTVEGAFFLSSSTDETALYGDDNANVVGSEINASSTTEATVEIPFANDEYNTTAKTLAFCNKSHDSKYGGIPAVVNIISVTYNGLSTMEKATSATANNFADETDSTVYMYTYDAQTGRDVIAVTRDEYLASLENLSSTVTAYESTYNYADAVLLKAGAGNGGDARLTYIFDGDYTITENTYFQMNASAGGNVSVLFWDTKTDEKSGEEIYDSAYLDWTQSKKISLGGYLGKKLRGVEYAGNAGTYIYGWSIGESETVSYDHYETFDVIANCGTLDNVTVTDGTLVFTDENGWGKVGIDLSTYSWINNITKIEITGYAENTSGSEAGTVGANIVLTTDASNIWGDNDANVIAKASIGSTSTDAEMKSTDFKDGVIDGIGICSNICTSGWSGLAGKVTITKLVITYGVN